MNNINNNNINNNYKIYFEKNSLEEDFPFDIDLKDQQKFFSLEQIYNEITSENKFSLELV